MQLCPRSRKKPAIDSPATDIRIWQTAFETSPVAQLAIDSNRCLILANAKANTLFGLTLNDLGSSLQSLQLWQLPGLCQSFEKVNRDRNPATLENVGWKTANDTTYFNISITPVFNADTQLICLTEVSPPEQMYYKRGFGDKWQMMITTVNFNCVHPFNPDNQ
ncbi:PAS domain-containing protein [Coleofasciculus chthonoplastes]|uniref:PAS domain-containing protein n=1 Tax=Coleofasciculus chthonoplastes TaxID=64178 RepID=UPI0032F30093